MLLLCPSALMVMHAEPRPAVRCEPSAAVDFGRQLIRTVVTAPLSFWLLTVCVGCSCVSCATHAVLCVYCLLVRVFELVFSPFFFDNDVNREWMVFTDYVYGLVLCGADFLQLRRDVLAPELWPWYAECVIDHACTNV